MALRVAAKAGMSPDDFIAARTASEEQEQGANVDGSGGLANHPAALGLGDGQGVGSGAPKINRPRAATTPASGPPAAAPAPPSPPAKAKAKPKAKAGVGAGGDVSTVKGVGPKRAEALRRAGYDTVGALAAMSKEEAAAVAAEHGVALKELLSCVGAAQGQMREVEASGGS